MVIGILLLTFSVIALLSYVSFLFTGTYDQDILSLDRAGRIADRNAIRNLIGLPGAVLAQFMIDGSFGFVSILLVFMLAIYALRLMHVLKDIRAILLFCGGSFWVLWGSVVLGFAHNMTHQMGFFRWGGAFGEAAARWLVSYVNTLGAVLILLALLVIFLIVTDPRFIDRCKAFGAWVAKLFTRKKKEQIEEPQENSGEVVLDIPITDDPLPVTDDPSEGSDTVTFTIDPIVEDPQPETEKEPLPEVDDNDEPLGDAPLPMDEPEQKKDAELEIEDVVEDKLYDKDPDKILEKLGPYDPRKDLEFYKFPSLNLLKVYDNEAAPVIDEEEQRANGARIVTTLRNYGIEIESIKATVGPTVTLY
ncbi:MAG: DNA translocase FtsK 4TM domain-containing protein, partial [Clostridia bacterium]|nr:DNA translocase FtsK 4TM domain-containing protein [Clostridia bacterium]